MRASVLLVVGLVARGALADETAAKSPNAGKRVVVEHVVAVVNNAIILDSELRARMLPLLPDVMQITDDKERRRRLDKLTSQTLDDMVNEELIVQAAEQAKIEVDSSEVQAALDEIKHNNNLDDAGLAQALSAQGYTLANYRQDLRRQIMRLRAVNTIVLPKIQITDEDVRARYDQLARRSSSVDAVQLRHILFKLPENPTEQQIAEAKDKAARAIERVKNGEDFAKVAADVSEDSSTAKQGGELGWFQRGTLANPAWEQVVFAMQKGDVRGPVKGPQGLHVFYADEVKQNKLQPYAQLKEQLARELRRKELDKQTEVWVDELRKKAFVDIKLQ